MKANGKINRGEEEQLIVSKTKMNQIINVPGRRRLRWWWLWSLSCTYLPAPPVNIGIGNNVGIGGGGSGGGMLGEWGSDGGNL